MYMHKHVRIQFLMVKLGGQAAVKAFYVHLLTTYDFRLISLE